MCLGLSIFHQDFSSRPSSHWSRRIGWFLSLECYRNMFGTHNVSKWIGCQHIFGVPTTHPCKVPTLGGGNSRVAPSRHSRSCCSDWIRYAQGISKDSVNSSWIVLFVKLSCRLGHCRRRAMWLWYSSKPWARHSCGIFTCLMVSCTTFMIILRRNDGSIPFFIFGKTTRRRLFLQSKYKHREPSFSFMSPSLQ